MTLAALAFALALFQPGVELYGAPGPAVTRSQAGGQTCTIFRPAELKPGAHVILWGNGTGVPPVGYAPLLHHLASHGFVVAAANTPMAGSGADMLKCLDWLTAENGREGGPYFGKLDLTKVGATGHSQGGGGAIMAGRDPRIVTTAPLMGAVRDNAAPAQQHGPMLLLSAANDAVVTQERQKAVFDSASVPVLWMSREGAGHLTAMRNAGPYRGVLTAWFLYRLEGDEDAASMFTGARCGYCTNPSWAVQRRGGG